MTPTSEEFLKKTVFWQRLSAILLSIFLFILFCYYCFELWIIEVYDYDWNWRRIREHILLLSYLSLAVFANRCLYQSVKAIKNYLSESEISNLELAFRKQRHFWMVITLGVLSFPVIAIVFVLFGL